jgi:osmoprotectant transport system permease protein
VIHPVLAEPFVQWSWVGDHLSEIGSRTAQHLFLTVVAVGFGLAISLPLAVFAHRHPRWYPPIASVAGVLYTIPSIALFVLLLPITGISNVTAEIALVSYTLLILIRNTVAGLGSVPEDTKEAARGMGYTNRQLLWKVELPLALPVIVAGVRIATVSTIGLVTVAALIGKGGLGQFILEGLRTFFTTETVIGALLSVALALVADLLLLGLERALTPWARSRRPAKPFVPSRAADLPLA